MMSVSVAASVGISLVNQTAGDQTDKTDIIASRPPPSKPDLTITFIEITDAYGASASSDNGVIIGAGQEFSITLEITNVGTASASPFYTDLYIDQPDGTSKYCGRQNCSTSLAAAGVFSLTWPRLYTSVAGASVVRAVTDSTGTNLESNEGNNVKILTNTVNNAVRTLAIYMCADCDLEMCEIDSFVNDMASPGAGSSRDVSVIVMMDRWYDPTDSNDDTRYGNWTDAKYFFVKEGSTCYPVDAVMDIGEVDMGDPTILHNFLTWGFDRYRASKYDLVLVDHGMATQGVCYDAESNNDYISMNELTDVLQDVTGHMGTVFDMIGFDACYQSWLDNAYACRQYTNAILGSVEPQFSDGWAYSTIFRQLRATPSMAVADLCSLIVDTYIASTPPTSGFQTMAAFRSPGIDRVVVSVDDLSKVLISKLGEPTVKAQLQLARGVMEDYPIPYPQGQFGVDIYDMAVQLKAACTDPEIDNAAQNVINAIRDPNTVIDYGAGFSHDLARIRCLGLMWPESISVLEFYSISFAEFRATYFSQSTTWDDFIAAYLDVPPVAAIDQISPNPVNQGVTVSFSGHGTDSDGTITAYSWRSSIDGQLSASSSFSTSALSAGIHTIYFEVQDDMGVWSPEVQYRLEVVAVPDNPPTKPGVPSITPGDEIDGKFTLTWTPSVDTDLTPVAGYWLVESFNGGAYTNVSTNIPTNSINLTRGPGSYVYTVIAFDTSNPPKWSGWTTPDFIHPIVVPDTTPPSTTATVSGTTGSSGWWKSATVTLTATDPSGIQITYYKLDSAMTYSTYTGPVPLSDSKHTVYFYSIDTKGNQETTKSISINVDSKGPTTTASYKISGTTATVTLKASDSTSGVAAIYYSLDGGNTYVKYTGQFKVTGSGPHTVWYYSVDNAGNSETPRPLTFTI